MTIKTSCGACGLQYAVVLSSGTAHPGNTVSTGNARVDVYDHQGRRAATTTQPSSHWVARGPSAKITHRDVDDATAEASWTCTCGATVTYEHPRVYIVECRHDNPDGGPCRVRRNQIAPPLDRYVNPSHGQACPCCKHAGTHRLRWGQVAACGATPGGAS